MRSSKRHSRLVVSYTTLPGRYDLLRQSVKSILAQTLVPDTIYLTLPVIAKRLNTSYPPLPSDLEDIVSVITPSTDYGPICKLYGALFAETDADALIITCDDDTIYPPDFIMKLWQHYQESDEPIAIAGTGCLIGKGMNMLGIYSSVKPFDRWNRLFGCACPPTGRNVDILFGVSGVLYQRGFFPKKENLEEELFRYTKDNDAIFHNDDVLISGYLEHKKIKRKIFSDIPGVSHANAPEALSADFFKMFTRMGRAVKEVQAIGFLTTTEEISTMDSAYVVAGLWVAAALFIIVMIILAIWVAYRLYW